MRSFLFLFIGAIFKCGRGIRIEAVESTVSSRYGGYPTLQVTIESDPYPTLEEITWTKGSSTADVTSSERFSVGGKGTELNIALTRASDYDTYTCRVSGGEGLCSECTSCDTQVCLACCATITLASVDKITNANVDLTPLDKTWTKGENIDLSLKGPTTLDKITWYKGTYPITKGGRYSITTPSSLERKLVVSTSEVTDNGEYAVVYSILENSQTRYDIKVFTITILGTPLVTIFPAIARVTEGSDVTFTCQVDASTTSIAYLWSKNGAAISQANNDKLVISDAKHENAAQYSCTVSYQHNQTPYSGSNVCYLVINDDITLEVLTPFLLADVNSPSATLTFKVTSRNNDQVTGDMVTWYKDSKAITEEDGISFGSSKFNLIIANPTAADEGYYRVIVRMTTVTLEGSMQLAVYSALPSIKFSEATYVGRSGEYIIIVIEVGGNPVPQVGDIQWYLNDERVYQDQENVRFSEDYLQLSRSKLTVDDAGHVKVVVETTAGRTEETAEIQIIKLEDIQKSRTNNNQLLGKTIDLEVSFHLMPLPVEQNVEWKRSSQILSDTDARVEFYKSGQKLLIKDAQLSDGVTHTVTVQKPDGGSSSMDLIVSVRTKTEKLAFSSTPTDITIEEGQIAVIPCDVSGVPSPTITFTYGNDTQIPNWGRFYITNNKLEIWSAQVGDSNSFKCMGDNGDETIVEEFTVTVNERIKLEVEASDVSTTIGSTASFTVYMKPTTAVVTWTRKGIILPVTDGGHYDVQIDPSFIRNGESYRKVVLTISQIQSSDMGTYEATASLNEDDLYDRTAELTLKNAGSTMVAITASSGDISAYRGNNAQFTCSVSIEQSTILWSKNGVDVTQLDDSIKARYTLSVSKQELNIQGVVEGDEGLYVCLVTKDTGSDQASGTLSVLPPVKITQYPSHRRLLLGAGSNFEMSVKVDSQNANSQSVVWYQGVDIISENTKSLSLPVPSAAGTTKYTVRATLATWLDQGQQQDSVDIYVETYSASEEVGAVIIQAPEDQTAILGSSVTFVCVSYGIPDPSIKWSSETIELSTDMYTNKYTNSGVHSTLVISNVQKTDQKEYYCKADNNRGEMEAKPVYLEIINPPNITPPLQSVYYGVAGRSLEIQVAVDFQNTITKSMCTWSRNGAVMVEEANKVSFGTDGTKLTITTVESKIAGLYRFTIQTDAGSASTSTTLQIIEDYQRPTATIPQYYDVVRALRGSVYFLKCSVDGKPVPDVEWRRSDGVVFKETGEDLEYSLQSDSSLRIAAVQDRDNGTWTCIASSTPEGSKLEDMAELQLEVVGWLARPFVYPYYGHDRITVVSGDTLDVNIEVLYRYHIRAHNIVWRRLDFGKTDWDEAEELNLVDPGYDNVVEFDRDRRTLQVHRISKLFEGYYRAYVMTVAGNADTTIEVRVISRVPAEIRWRDTIGGSYYTVNGEEDFVFNVTVTGEPFPKEITWYKKTGQQYEGIRNGTIGNYNYLVGYNGSLYLNNPDKSSSGYYKIQVIPENGGQDQMAEESVELIVKDYYLGFQEPPYTGGIKPLGTAVTLTCKARGVPDPEGVEWYHGITKLPSTSAYYVINAIKKDDKGDYYCVAGNDYGTIYSAKVALQVQYLDENFDPISCYKEEKSNGQIELVACTSNNLEEGDVFSLKCNSPDGWPFPKTSWSYNNRPIDGDTNTGGTTASLSQYGDLIFPFALPEQSGKYKCQVTNDAGSLSNTDEFTVNISPAENTEVDNKKTAEWLIQPDDVTVAQHTPVTIACLVSSFPAPTYQWEFNGEQLATGEQKDVNGLGTRTINFGGRLLTFDLIDKQHDGMYTCKTTVEGEGSKESSFKLQVATRPDFGKASIFQVGRVGNETEIDLGTPTGHPVPTVVWTFNGEGIQLGNRIKLIDNKKLRIDPTQKGDEGIWQATATNKAGSAQHALYLKIEEQLEFTEQPSTSATGSTLIAQYNTVKFPCKVRGTPSPEIYKWHREKHLDEPFNGLPARAYMDEENSLIIPNAQTWDNGTYICNVTNKYYEFAWSSAVLYVIEPPSIATPPQDYNIDQFGDESQLTCKCEPQAVALQNCKVTWKFNGAAISDQDISLKVLDYASVLTISNTQERHLGMYNCHGQNDFGTANAYAYITKSNEPYMVSRPATDIEASSKSSVNLKCGAIGFMPIHYTWTFNEIPVVGDDTRLFVDSAAGTLLIDGALSTDTGSYTCYASNPFGQTSATTSLIVNGPPVQPRSPWVSQITESNGAYGLTINVDTSDYKHTSVKFIYTLTDKLTNSNLTKVSSDNPYTWQYLSSASYEVSVVVQNTIDKSPHSEPTGLVNFADYPTIPKTCVIGLKLSDDKTKLQWTSLSGATKYKIYKNEVGAAESRSYLGEATDPEFQISEISALKNFTLYDFQVVSVTSGREGLYSAPFRLRTHPSPPTPPSITGFSFTDNPYQIIVEFDRVWQLTSGIIAGFQVYYKHDKSDYSISRTTNRQTKRQTQSVTAGSAATNIIIEDLVPGEPYTFTVKATNENALESELSTMVNTTTKTGIPGVPSITLLEGSGRDAIEVKWSAPSITNGQIIGYYVYYRLENSLPDVAARLEVNATAMSKNVTGLVEKTRYDFAVSSFTTAGEGEKTSWSDMTPRSKSVPNKMSTPFVTVFSWNTIEVNWVLLDDGLTGIDTFTIYIDSEINRGGQSSYVIPNRNDRFARITSLDEDTSYVLSIVATNNIGSSERSQGFSFRTPKKPVYLRVWVAGTITGVIAFLLIILFGFLFWYFIYRKQPHIHIHRKKNQIPHITGGGGGSRPGDNGSLVLGNPVTVDQAERYSSRTSRADELQRRNDLEMRNRQPSGDNYSNYSKSRKPYDQDRNYAPSYNGSYNKADYYDTKPPLNDKRHDDYRYNDDHRRYEDDYRRYDDDRFSSDNRNNKKDFDYPPDNDQDGDGFVIDNPAAARFSQI